MQILKIGSAHTITHFRETLLLRNFNNLLCVYPTGSTSHQRGRGGNGGVGCVPRTNFHPLT